MVLLKWFYEKVNVEKQITVAQSVEHKTGDQRLLVWDSPPMEPLRCVLEQDTVTAA